MAIGPESEWKLEIRCCYVCGEQADDATLILKSALVAEKEHHIWLVVDEPKGLTIHDRCLDLFRSMRIAEDDAKYGGYTGS